MISQTTESFRKAFRELPNEVQEKAKKAYNIWKQHPSHPNIKFKQIHPTEPIYSVRIGLRWRAIGVMSGHVMIWFWIGSHAEYDKLVSQL